jgi:hypothetical protein
MYIRVGDEISDVFYHTFDERPSALRNVDKIDEVASNDTQNNTLHPECVTSVESGNVNSIVLPVDTRSEIIPSDYNYSSRTRLNLDAHLASCLVWECKLFPKFRNRLLKFAKRHCTNKRKPENNVETQPVAVILEETGEKLKVDFVIEVIPIYPKQKVDYAWNYRTWEQVMRRMLLEEAFAWFSTLGGAYSSLGDHSPKFAEEAGKIAIKQLKIAEEEGDPILASKAKLFFAQSLMQRGYINESKRIIQCQTAFAKSLILPDSKLLTMCRALRKRWKFVNNNVLSQ